MTLISDRVDISNYMLHFCLQWHICKSNENQKPFTGNFTELDEFSQIQFFLFFDINTVHEPPNATVII